MDNLSFITIIISLNSSQVWTHTYRTHALTLSSIKNHDSAYIKLKIWVTCSALSSLPSKERLYKFVYIKLLLAIELQKVHAQSKLFKYNAPEDLGILA